MDVPLQMRLMRYKNVFFAVLTACVVLTAFLIKMKERKKQSENDFVAAANAFNHWEKVLEVDHEQFKQLTTLMKKHPELATQYDAKLAQHFIAAEEKDHAQEFGQKALKRTNQPYYKDYAETSLMISQRRFSEALQEALQLKEKLLLDNTFWEKSRGMKGFGSGLFAFNLMRIATLYEELEMKAEELSSWKELRAYAGWGEEQKDKRIPLEGFQALLNHFTVQDITLLDYIKIREKKLSQ